MKKVLLASAALMVAGGMYVAAASAAEVKPGVVIDGDARVRLFYKSEEYVNAYGNAAATNGGYDSQTNMDTRVRFNLTGTTAGGTYAKARVRFMENAMGNLDQDADGASNLSGSNLWADLAYVGIPFNDMFTLEIGKYRSTYGPLPTTYNFFYDDVQLSGFRGIIKFGDIVINPFVEWMNEAQNSAITPASTNPLVANNSAGTTNAFINGQATTYDKNQDNDEYRIGAHVKAKINKDWTVGGMLGYQIDNRTEVVQANGPTAAQQANEGLFASVYANGKAGQFGIVGEFSYTAAELNGMNSWTEDNNANSPNDLIGSKDDGFGGFIFPNYQIDKLNLGLNLGFTTGGFHPDRAFGFVMIGGKDNSVIGDTLRIGDTGDWMWIGFVPSYQISETMKLTGNLVYAEIDKWDTAPLTNGLGGGPYIGTVAAPLDNAFEVSVVLQYTLSKGTDLYFSGGYMKPSFDGQTWNGTASSYINDDALLGFATRLEVKF